MCENPRMVGAAQRQPTSAEDRAPWTRSRSAPVGVFKAPAGTCRRRGGRPMYGGIDPECEVFFEVDIGAVAQREGKRRLAQELN